MFHLEQPLQRGVVQVESLSELRADLLRYCEFLCASHYEAEDIVQTTLLKALPVMQGSRQHPNITALLRRIAKNTWLDHVRKHQKCQPYNPVELSAWFGFIQPEDPFEVEAAMRILVSQLTSKQRIVFLLCGVFSFTDTEAAELLGISRETVKAALQRARAKLRSESPRLERSSGEEASQADQTNQTTQMVQAEILKAYVAAFQAGDIAALVHLCLDGTLDWVVATNKVLAFSQRQTRSARNRKDFSTATSMMAAA